MNTVNGNNLSERAMLARLSISCWNATRTDKKVTRDVADQHNVDATRAGHYRKFAINVKAPSYKRVTEAASALRTFHYFNTLPWGDEGARILTAQAFERYSTGIRKLKDEYTHAVEEFLADFPALKEKAKRELNGLFNEGDYPVNIRSKFGVAFGFLPLPAGDDFRVNLADADVAAIRAGITESVANEIHMAQREPYERLLAGVRRMADTLRDPKAIFRDTLVTGLADILDVLPGLNLTGDRQLDVLGAQAAKLLEACGSAPDILRTVPSVRANVAEQAAQQAAVIESTMAGFFT